MSTPDERYLSHRRRAAAAALSEHLTADSLRDALWLLQQEFTTPGVHSLIRFVDAVTARFGIHQTERKRLYAELFRWMNSVDERDLPDDPWPLMNGAEQAVSSPLRSSRRVQGQSARPDRVEDVVFFGLIQALLSLLANRSVEEQQLFHGFLDSSIRQLNWIGAGSEELCSWLAELETLPKSLSLSPEQMSAVVHAVYLAFCLAVGRHDADELFEQAVATVRRLPESRGFPPERLLWSDLMIVSASSH